MLTLQYVWCNCCFFFLVPAVASRSQAIGVHPDERGLLNVNDSYQTEQAGVYACGDVIGYPALASTSMEQGVRAAHHMWSDQVRVGAHGAWGGRGAGGRKQEAGSEFCRIFVTRPWAALCFYG